MKSAGKARNNGLYRHIRTSKEIIRNLLNDLSKCKKETLINIKDVYSNCYQGIRCIDAESMSVVTRNFIGSAFSVKAYQKS
mgnify:CR=1 FL=1